MKENFFKYQAQTTDNPISLQILKASGSYIYDTNNNKYLDFVAGVSASNLGHNNKKIKKAVLKQIDLYWHVMVYGEFIQKPTVKLCKLLSQNLPKLLSNTYLTNSGTEAIEAAMKLAKRVTGKSELIAAKNGYHGNTQGAMSIMGFEERKRAYRPLIPDIKFIEFNNIEDISIITNKTAGVIVETIQGGAGFILPEKNYLKLAESFFLNIEEKYLKKNIQHSYSKEVVFLEDYAFLINALNDLSDKTMNFRYKDLANKFSIEAMNKFYLKEKSIFQKNQKNNNDIFFRPIDIGDNTIPNGNAIMLINLIRLGLKDEAKNLANSLNGYLNYYKTHMMTAIRALDFFNNISSGKNCNELGCKINDKKN